MLRNLLQPAVRLMNRLAGSIKPLILATVFALALAAPTYQMISGLNTDIAFARRELIGANYLPATLALIQHIQQHRGMAAAFLGGDRSFEDLITQQQTLIAEDIRAINILEEIYGVEFGSLEKWETIKTEWGSLESDLRTLSAEESNDRHVILLDKILDYQILIADASYLTLDPDQDSYYLMIAATSDYPTASELMGQARAYGTAALAEETINEQKDALLILSQRIRDAIDRAADKVGKAAEANPSVRVKVEQAYQQTTAQEQAFLNMLDERVINAPIVNIAAAEYLDAATQAIDSQFVLMNILTGELTRLLEARIQRLAAQRALTIGLVSGMALLAAWLFSGFYLSSTLQLQGLVDTLEQRVVERTQALSTVAEVSAAASVILETDKLLQEVNDLTKERFGFYHAHIYLLDAEEKNLVLASGAGEAGRRMVAEGRSIPLDREQSLVARAARERKGVIVNDVTQSPDFLPNPLLPDTRSELAVPMIVGENLVGVFDVQSDQIGRFTQPDADIQTTLAAQIASSVQNARFFSRTQSALTQSEKLFEGSRRIAQTDDLQEMMNSLLALIDIPIINGALLLTHNRDNQNNIESVDIAANWWSGVGDPVYPVGARFSIADTPGLEAFVSPENLFFRDIYADQRTQGNMQESGIRSMVVLPLFIGSRQIGAFSLLGMQPYDFTQDEIQLFSTLAPQIAAKLDNRRQFERAQKQAERETMLNAISQKIQSAATLESALQVAARELGHALGGKPTLVELELADNASGQENAQKESLA